MSNFDRATKVEFFPIEAPKTLASWRRNLLQRVSLDDVRYSRFGFRSKWWRISTSHEWNKSYKWIPSIFHTIFILTLHLEWSEGQHERHPARCFGRSRTSEWQSHTRLRPLQSSWHPGCRVAVAESDSHTFPDVRVACVYMLRAWYSIRIRSYGVLIGQPCIHLFSAA